VRATAKASRTYMPDEKCLTGVSRNFSTSAKATISSNLRLISTRLMPRIAPFKKMFSRLSKTCPKYWWAFSPAAKALELYGFARRDWGKKIRKVARKTVKLSTLFAADRSFRATRSRNSGGARMSASRASKARF
jgi:hypothetical protein